MSWKTTDGRLYVDEPCLTGPVKVDMTDGGERSSFLYDPSMDSITGDPAEEHWLLSALRPQLDELRGQFFRDRGLAGLPLHLAEVLWKPAIYLNPKRGEFVIPSTDEHDVYPREVRYGSCDASTVLEADNPASLLWFDGFRITKDKPWVKADGTVTPVTDIRVERAPLAETTPCDRPWASDKVDSFLDPTPSSDWLRLPIHDPDA